MDFNWKMKCALGRSKKKNPDQRQRDRTKAFAKISDQARAAAGEKGRNADTREENRRSTSQQREDGQRRGCDELVKSKTQNRGAMDFGEGALKGRAFRRGYL